MNPEAAFFLAFVLAFPLGLLVFYVCVHRPARREWATERTEHALTVNRLEMQLASAEADGEALETERDQLLADAEWHGVHLTTVQHRAEMAEMAHEAATIALGYATLRADGVASLSAARLARGAS